MPDTNTGRPKAALGVGSLIGESFSIFFAHFLQVMAVAFVPIVLGSVISGLLIGFDVSIGIKSADFTSVGSSAVYLFSTVIEMAVGNIAAALLVQLAYDAKLRRPVRLGRYVVTVLNMIVPLAVLSFVANALMGIGLVLLIIPGLWINAVFYVMVPAVVIERKGFYGLGRSASLTKDYVLPVMGLVILGIAYFLTVGTTSGIFIEPLLNTVGTVFTFILLSVLASIEAGLAGILVALTYARLREIKEGVSVNQIASVFD
ncbi:hypothetical protein [Roseibium sp.]|uniref:hypothetical protein n=1 Tax=Roseibium sp. TaxID=1936156 RepID=UPI003A97C83F